MAEAVLIVRHTVGHQLDQQIPAQHEDVQAAEASGVNTSWATSTMRPELSSWK